ncbi:immunoglobulin I-set domain protein, partial [Cooperia oncophora]
PQLQVQKLATESAEPSTFVQIEIIKPNESSEEVLTIVDAEKLIPDLLRVAAAASKLKMENVTVSLVKQGDTAHQELVIEYESHIEDAVDFNLSHFVYEGHKSEVSTRQERWSRRSRYSDVDDKVVAVFMEVDATCPDQSVEIVASVSMPAEVKVDRPPATPSPEIMEVSESLTESSNAVGQQIPRFTKTLQDCHTVVGRSAQFKCIVSGMPPPEVAWYVDGDVIQSSREYEIVYEDGVCILRINEALAEDEGEYSCEAKNSAGKAVTKCYLKVLIHSCRSAYVLFCVLCLSYVCCLAAALPSTCMEMTMRTSPFSISEDEPPPAPRFIEHAPSLVELVDDAEDSFDSFEWEEKKANKLFASDTESLHPSSVTYNSEFDLSRIVNYNEDMKETNAFHRYFDTAEAGVRVLEWEQRERLYASFLSRPAASARLDLIIPKPASYSSAAHLFAIPSIQITHADIVGSHEKSETELQNERPGSAAKTETKEPREPDLPSKMSYKGQEIAISVNEIEKEEMTLNESGEVEISKKTCMETSLEFDTELDITQSIRKIRNALPEENDDFDLGAETKVENHEIPAEPTEKPDLSDRPRAQSTLPKPRPLGKQASTAKLESTMFDPEFLSKMKEIERIARQVDEELGHLSSSPRPTASPPEDAKEIEEAIYKISDQLMLARPITEAQAEANEELLRTTLADMILNPSRTAAEEIELMTRPIQLLKRKLSDLENSLLEDAEVTDITEHPCPITETAILTGETPPVLRAKKGSRNRVPSAGYLRVTPLTTNIKDQLSSLEEMISQMNGETSDSTTDDADTHPLVKGSSQKKRELHDLFVQINNEINTIKTYCRTQLSKRGTDAVMNVLHKVRTHVTSIVNVMSLSKRKHAKAIDKHAVTVTTNCDFGRPSETYQTEVVVMTKSSSVENSDYHRSSTAVSTSDDTWKYSTDLKSALKGVVPNGIDEEDEPPLIGTVECTTEEEAPAPAPAPIAPPRRRRTRSADAEPTDPPSRPPRKMKESLKKRDLSLDNKRTPAAPLNGEKPGDSPILPSKDASPPGKTKKSFAGDTFDMLRNFSCVRAQKGQEDLEKSLLEELSQMAVTPKEDEVLSEPEWVQNELEESLKRGAERAKVERSKDIEVELEPVSIYETPKATTPEREIDAKEKQKVMALPQSEKPAEAWPGSEKPPTAWPEAERTAEAWPKSEKPPEAWPEAERAAEAWPKLEKPPEAWPKTEKPPEEWSEPERAAEAWPKLEKPPEAWPKTEKPPEAWREPERTVETAYAGTSLSAAYLLLSEATASLEIPLTSVMTTSGDIWAEDGLSSVQMTCEESDYATDTDTSALLKGTVQFFNKYSPRGTPQSNSSMSASQRNSKVMPDLSEQDESVEIAVDVELNKTGTSNREDVELHFNEVSMMTKSDEKGKRGYLLPPSHDKVSPEKESISEDTVHLVLEEAHLSQMVSSEWTDDTDGQPSSRMGMRETDILSDDSVITEIDRSIIDNIDESFTFTRAPAKKALIAVVFPDVRMFASARIADNTFDVEIHQEPESLSLVIRVVEDQVNFTSLTVTGFIPAPSDAQRGYDELDELSSIEDVEGESRTGITVSIVARSLHDGIYASLEEIPWGEVEMTLPECDTMGKSLEDESKTSVQFNVTVSESNPDERKSLRSQASLEQSQNTISEADNTLSNGSINIPSYVIKLGSTATITCELNNYLPPNSKIDWYKGTAQVKTCPGKLDRISHDLLEVLIINNIEMEDNELYSLKVNDDIFPVAYLIVEAPSTEEFGATILTPPQTQFVMEGQPTVLMCQVSDPNQEVVWLKERKPLKETARLQLENSGDGWSRVIFSQTRMSDQGTYFAFVGDQSVAITLVVEERIDEKEVTVVASGTESEDEDVQEYLMPPGSTATIACELEDGDHVPSLVWLKNGQEIAFTDPNKMEHVVNGLKHYLVIHDTSPKDTGLYSVSISNTEFRVAHLAVNDLATVSQNLRRKRISNSSLH